MVFRGAEAAAPGQRFTLEVLILNTGSTPLTDLEFHAKLDDNLDQPSKEREHRLLVEAIAPDDLRIVRLSLTPRKSGTGRLDITLRHKSGAMQQVNYVMPIAADRPPPAEQKPTATSLQVKVTPLKECIVDRPGIVLVNVRNTDPKPMPKSLELMVLYSSVPRGDTITNAQFGGGAFHGSFGGSLGQQGGIGAFGGGAFEPAGWHWRSPKQPHPQLPSFASRPGIWPKHHLAGSTHSPPHRRTRDRHQCQGRPLSATGVDSAFRAL